MFVVASNSLTLFTNNEFQYKTQECKNKKRHKYALKTELKYYSHNAFLKIIN